MVIGQTQTYLANSLEIFNENVVLLKHISPETFFH